MNKVAYCHISFSSWIFPKLSNFPSAFRLWLRSSFWWGFWSDRMNAIDIVERVKRQRNALVLPQGKTIWISWTGNLFIQKLIFSSEKIVQCMVLNLFFSPEKNKIRYKVLYNVYGVRYSVSIAEDSYKCVWRKVDDNKNLNITPTLQTKTKTASYSKHCYQLRTHSTVVKLITRNPLSEIVVPPTLYFLTFARVGRS